MLEDQKIIIAGGGFAGVKAALALKDIAKKHQVILISDSSYHCYSPDLYQLGGTLLPQENKDDFSQLEGTVNIPLKKIFQGSQVKLVVDLIKQVKLKQNLLITTKQGELKYDFLLLCLGSETNYFDIPGAENFSHPLKNGADALNIRDDVEEKVIQTDRPLNIVIAGGGFTGVELAGSLAHFLKVLRKKYQSPVNHLIVVEAAQKLLLGMPDWAQKAALKKLRKLGVEILLNQPISQVTQDKICCQDKITVEFDYLVWTTGVRGKSLGGKIDGVQPNHKNQLEVDQSLSLSGYPNVFVAGDMAAVQDLNRNQAVASTAWAALGEAEVVAENIKRKIAGGRTIDYRPQEPIFVVTVGKKFALSNFGIFRISGIFGWGLKRLVSLKYFLSILPWFEALKLWFRGAKFYVASDLES